jgi:Domain of unknown function (DUF4386)
MYPTDKTARVAGVLYLLNGMTGAFSIVYVPRTLIVPGNATATANNILASEMLFRAGIVFELICAVIFICLARALNGLLSSLDKKYASLMVNLVLVSVPISFLNVLNELAALMVLRGASFPSGFEKQQRDTLAMLFIELHSQGLVVVFIFAGLWLLPLGILVMRSGFLPRILGILLIAACFGYLTGSFTSLLLPRFATVVNRFTIIAGAAGELPMMMWLLVRGAKVRQLTSPAL